jgi:hypothetical protein
MQAAQGVRDGVMLAFSMTGGTVTMTQVVVDPSGHDIAIKVVIHADGTSQPVRFGQGLILEARLSQSQRLEAVIRNGEHVVTQGAYEVAADRQTLTFSTSDTRMVFDRIGAR